MKMSRERESRKHTNLPTSRRYLSKVTDTEAIRLIDNLYF